ncbi:MAG TPA: transglycosylase domain-containing protein [Actinomycetota bacterium]|nr:transglycosylase domain-containing protein [Actinomycetota bacterium]
MPRSSKKLLALTLLLALMGASCARLSEQLTDLPKLKRKDLRFKLAQSSKVYDGSGNLLTTLHETENRTIIPLSRIPQHVQDAVVAIEDERFYQHDGVDVKAVLRALLTNAQSGEIREGGSTITQQLVKNVIISPGEIAERTLERKITEAALSRQLEQKLTKKEILESYLNTVYFGNGAYGVQEAAKTYFGRPASKLTLAQGAMIAGLIQSPENYDPYDKRKAALGRRNLVLSQMDGLDMAPTAKIEKARASKIRLLKVSKENRYPAPYFMDYVQRLITYDPRFEAVGETVAQRTKRLFKGGLRIHTTVDLDMQEAAEDAVERVLPNPEDPSASLVAIDPTTGYVKAMVGGRDYFAPRKTDPYAKLNLAILAEPNLGRVTDIEPVPDEHDVELRAPGTGRQAGSAFKAFALAAAVEEGIPLSKTYKAGSQIVFPGLDNGADYTVQNYEGGDFGSKLSLLEATVFSVNVVYAQLVINDVGEDSVVDVAERMGINGYNPLLAVPSNVLGSNEVNPLDMASGYGTLAANGTYNAPVAITRITGPDGEVIYKDETEPVEAIEPAVAYITTSALEQVIQRGTAASYGQIGRPAAGKTGTAQEYRDAWFVGYTPDLVASVWVGYPKGQIEMKPSCSVTHIGEREVCRPTRTLSSGGVTGGSFPTQIWAGFMLEALSGVPASSFPPPTTGTATVGIDTRTGCLATKLTPDEYRAQATFAAGTEPEKSCPVENDGEKVPNVVGFPADEAEETLERAGFEVDAVEEPTSTYPPGVVVGQSPAGGRRAAPGSTVTIAVSVPEREGGGDDDDDRVVVPDVLGQPEGSAESELHGAGFDVRVIYQSESDERRSRRNRGRVWKQSPASGSEADSGSTVTIWVNPP